MKLITGRAGENHVTSLHFRRILESIVGEESYIAPLGHRLAMELAANNTVIINSGMLFHHGGVFDVPEGTYDTVNYNNGTQGMKRIDLIAARYTMDDKGNETGEWVVIQGTPDATDPVAPECIIGNMQNGDTTEDCPVAELHFDGIYAVEVRPLLNTAPTSAELSTTIQRVQSEVLQSVKAELGLLKAQINGVRIKTGTIVKPSNGNSVALWTLGDLRKMFGATNADTNNFTCFIANGDGRATFVHPEGCIWKELTLYASYNQIVSGMIRFNYMLVYTPY